MADLNLFPAEPNPADIILRVAGASGPQTVETDGSITPTGAVVLTVIHASAGVAIPTGTLLLAVICSLEGSVALDGTVDVTVPSGPPPVEQLPPTYGGTGYPQKQPAARQPWRRGPIVVVVQIDGHIGPAGASRTTPQRSPRRRREEQLLLVL